jgi:PKD repeat protein
LLAFPLLAQVSEGGSPASFNRNAVEEVQFIRLDPPVIPQYDDKLPPAEEPQPYQIAEGIAVDIDLAGDGKWFIAPDGSRSLKLGIASEGARALIFYYDRFSLPEGGRLFIYSHDRTGLIGAFTSRNNPSGGYFATEAVAGDHIILEYDPPRNGTELPDVRIYQVHYVYRGLEFIGKGQSGPCEVNVNCPEGDSWQNEKRSVAKIVLKAGAGTYICTGALVNNVRQDSTPYFLTARHCGNTASLTDYSQWVFHFNYESLGCEEPSQPPPSSTISGSQLLAEAPYGTTLGSDFKLLLLDQDIPETYSPYFSGWSRSEYASPTGVGIHHPKGDIKKISTYISPLASSDYGSGGTNPEGMYWRVVWAETESGHGVTEGGSSGSPIFDNTGKIVGTLTGGGASCQALTEPDYYGKFSWHWDRNGSPGGAQLRPYLDPDNTGANSLGGFGYGSRLLANFEADTTTISIGGRISFDDKSDGEPESWRWAFSGGNPSIVTQQDPGYITYNQYGKYDVRLVVHDGLQSDTLTRKEYIRVTPNLYPNPTDNNLTIDFGGRQVEFIEIEAYDIYGRMAGKYENYSTTTGVWTVSLGNLRSGNYVLRIKTNVQEDKMPVIIY